MLCTTAPNHIAHSLVRASALRGPRRNPTLITHMLPQIQSGEATDTKWRGGEAASGTGAEAASRAPRARDQGRACARRASSHKSSPRARILSPEYVCVNRSVQCTNCHRRAYKLSPSCAVDRSGPKEERRAHISAHTYMFTCYMFLALPASSL